MLSNYLRDPQGEWESEPVGELSGVDPTVAALLLEFCQDRNMAAVPKEHHKVTTKAPFQTRLWLKVKRKEQSLGCSGPWVRPSSSPGSIPPLAEGQLGSVT